MAINRRVKEDMAYYYSVIFTIIDELGIEELAVKEESKIVSDLKINSLEILNVILALEEDFEITFDEKRFKRIKTVGDIAKCVCD